MRQLFVFISFFCCCTVNAQQYNTWYFGNGAGISFNAGGTTVPYILTDGVNSAKEGNASISDTIGNILFYTNGKTVFNRNHQVMLNGDNLAGDTSTVQSSIIIPVPGNDSIYYIFTADAFENNYAKGYSYSMVNMKHDAGMGEVVTKNVLLSNGSSERLTAARHANGIDVWIIGNERNSNIFKSWLMNCAGLQTTAVISAVGVIITASDPTTSGMGMMKVSPDGSQLCQTINPEYLGGRFFQLFDFDNATGRLTNARAISNTDCYYWACEFSPDSKLLYIIQDRANAFIDQFQIKLGSEAAINASRVSIPTTVIGFTGIQSGTDRKIYLNRNTMKLSVISDPNLKGPACNFELDKINLNKNGRLQLPSVINDWPFDPYNYFTPLVIDSCKGIVQFNGQTAMGGTIQWYWDFGDGTTSTVQNPQHAFSPYNQPYTVKLTISSATSCGYIKKTKDIFPRGTFTKPGFDFASRCDSGYVRFMNTSIILPDTGAVQYSWDFGDGNTSIQKDPVHSYAASGVYSVKLEIKTGTACLDDSVSKNLDLQQLNIQASPDQTIDAGQPVQLFVTGGGSRFQWSPSRWLDNPAIANPVARPMGNITYAVTATDTAGCKAVDSVFIKVNNPVVGINVPTAFTPNSDGLNDIIRPLIGMQYTLGEFSIFNRWGQKIYSTSEPGAGWDGNLNDRLQDTGIYAWIIKVTDAQDKTIIKKGTVALIR